MPLVARLGHDQSGCSSTERAIGVPLRVERVLRGKVLASAHRQSGRSVWRLGGYRMLALTPGTLLALPRTVHLACEEHGEAYARANDKGTDERSARGGADSAQPLLAAGL